MCFHIEERTAKSCSPPWWVVSLHNAVLSTGITTERIELYLDFSIAMQCLHAAETILLCECQQRHRATFPSLRRRVQRQANAFSTMTCAASPRATQQQQLHPSAPTTWIDAAACVRTPVAPTTRPPATTGDALAADIVWLAPVWAIPKLIYTVDRIGLDWLFVRPCRCNCDGRACHALYPSDDSLSNTASTIYSEHLTGNNSNNNSNLSGTSLTRLSFSQKGRLLGERDFKLAPRTSLVLVREHDLLARHIATHPWRESRTVAPLTCSMRRFTESSAFPPSSGNCPLAHGRMDTRGWLGAKAARVYFVFAPDRRGTFRSCRRPMWLAHAVTALLEKRTS